jgi:O-antigen/teichoic acid export membrane protein
MKFLSGRPALQRVLGNSSWLIADRLMRMMLGLVLGALIARHLGPVGIGKISFALAVVGFFSALATLGVDTLTVKRFIDHPDEINATLQTALIMRVLAGLFSWMLAIAAAFIAANNDGHAIAMVAIYGLTLVFNAADAVDLYFQSRLESRRTVMSKSVAFFSTAALRVILVYIAAPAEYFIVAMTLEIILGAILLIKAIPKSSRPTIAGPVNKSIAHELLVKGWPLALSSIMVAIYMKVDQVLVARLLGMHDLGIYSSAVKISEIWQIIPMALVPSSAPVIAAAKRQSQSEYENKLVKLFATMLYGGVAIAILVTIFAHQIIALLFGAQFAQSAEVLQLLIWALPFQFLGVAIGPWTVNEGKMHLSLKRTIFGAIFSVTLLIWLLPTVGVRGAALAMIAAQIITNIILNLAIAEARPVLRLQVRACFLRFN